MGIKDLFEKPQQILTSEDAESITKDKVESEEYLDAALRRKEEFVPYVNYTSASNFALYGSAEKYYDDAVRVIHREYPYDGSKHEIEEYKLGLNFLAKHVFDNLYPRTNGYIILGKTATYTGAPNHSGSYGAVASNEYIKLFGGPHTGSHIQHGIMGAVNQPLHKIFKHANKLQNDPYHLYGANKGNNPGQRLSNLRFSPNTGMTVEFWLKKSAFVATNTQREVIFDLWNGKDRGDSAYGRMIVELSASATNPFRVSLISGSTTTLNDVSVAPSDWAQSNITSGKRNGWNHYAVTISGSVPGPRHPRTEIKFYYNGDLINTTKLLAAIQDVTGGLQATIGALQTGTLRGGGLGYGLLSGSLDEFRYWTTARTSEQIGRNWFTHIHGGTNDEPYNTSLGVYYKFNEGITKNSTTDSRILDYSGRLSNGKWVGYPGSAVRQTGSAIVESQAAATEYKDPIIYKDHPSVVSLSTNLKLSGSAWDDSNNASLLSTIPDWIIEEDKSKGDGSLNNVVQLMGSYFDQAHQLITALPKIRATSYLTASAKPYPFATHLLESLGLNTPQLFVQANVLESIGARDEDRNYIKDISEAKNLIYQNIYNNLIYIYKSKGTEKSIRNLIRCFGIDDELVRLNLYSSNTTYELKQNTRTKTAKTKFINFNDPDKWQATIYQYPDPYNSNTVGYISGSGATTVTASLGNEELNGMTAEVEIVLPQNLEPDEQGYFRTTFLTSSVFGMHTAHATPTTLTIPTPDYANFQVVAIRPEEGSKHAFFMLTSSASPYVLPELSSSLFLEAYNNQKWNLSVRVKPTLPITDFVTGSAISTTYDVHFYGVNIEGGVAANSFHVSGTIPGHVGRNMLRSRKRLYVGAQRENHIGTVKLYSDVSVSSLKYWATFLDTEDLKTHARDPENYGISDPYKNLNLYSKKLGGIRIPKIETLALHWTFDNVTGPSSDAGDPSTKDSIFYVDDYSSGSSEIVASNRYGWMTPILKNQHSGKGDRFLPPESGDANPVIFKYLSAARQQGPEVLNTSDAIQILRQDDDKFTREHSIIEHYYALEKSMYQTISEEMINMFATVVDFNNLIGDPVNRYRQEYKDLSKLRQLFYERIGNTPDLDRFIGFYKWIDSAITTAIEQMIPASAEVSDELYNMIESHVLERNKYWTKFPTMEFKQGDPEAGARGVHELTYDWKHGHAPLSGLERNNSLYWRDRAIRTDEQLKSGQAGVDNDKEELRKKVNQHRNDTGTTLANANGTTYTGRVYALKRFTKPYKFSIEDSPEYRTGVNLSGNNRRDIIQAALEPGAPLTISSSAPLEGTNKSNLPTSAIVVDGAKIESFKDVSDKLDLNKKRYYKGEAVYGKAQGFDQRNNNTTAVTTIAKGVPARVVSSSVNSGYNAEWVGTEGIGSTRGGFITGSTITNIHHDSYGRDQEAPLQSPFTEKYVGGKQSRHVRLNPGTDSFKNRPEEWRILVGKAGTPTPLIGAFGFVSQDYPYPDIGQKPVASTGILTFSNTAPSDGDKLIISDGTTNKLFEFESGGGVSINAVSIAIGAALTRATRVAAAINGQSDLNILATPVGSSIVNLENTTFGTATAKGNAIRGSRGNVTITWTGSDAALPTLKGMSGGKDPIILNYHAPKATRYREELIKRPVNIKNILQTTASVDIALSSSREHGPIGNYSHNYEIVQTSPRSVNNLYLRKGNAVVNTRSEIDFINPRHVLRKEGPKTGFGEWQQGEATNTADFTLPTRDVNKTVITTRFSAPGGYESISRGYLEPNHEEMSPNNSIFIRNRNVRGLGKFIPTSASLDALPDKLVAGKGGGAGTFAISDYGDGNDDHQLSGIRVYDIHDQPWGLRTHLTRWTARFGRDSAQHPLYTGAQLGAANAAQPGRNIELEKPGFHKVHRNRTVNILSNETHEYVSVATGVTSNRGMEFNYNNAANSSDNLLINTLGSSIAGALSTNKFTVAMWVNFGEFPTTTTYRTLFAMGGTTDEHHGGGSSENHAKDPSFAIQARQGAAAGDEMEIMVYLGSRSHRDTLGRDHVAIYTLEAGDSNITQNDSIYNIIVSYDPDTSAGPNMWINGVDKSSVLDRKVGGADVTPTAVGGRYMSIIGSGEPLFVGGGRGMGGTSAHQRALRSAGNSGGALIIECALWLGMEATSTTVAEIYPGHEKMANLGSSTYLPNSAPNLLSWWRMGDGASKSGTPDYTQWSSTTNPDDPSHAIFDVNINSNYDTYGARDLIPMNATDDFNVYTEGNGGHSNVTMQPTTNIVLQKTVTFTNQDRFDNAHVQHALPRNHGNYSWIQKGVMKPHIPIGLPTASDALQFVTGSDFRSIVVKTSETERQFGISDQRISFQSNILNNSSVFTDFIGINSHVVEPISSSTNTLGHPLGTPLAPPSSRRDNLHLYTPQYLNGTFANAVHLETHVTEGRHLPAYVFNALMLHRQGPYGWPSWKQIRGGEHPIIRLQKKNSEFSFVLPDADELELSSSSGRRIIRPRHGKIHHHKRTTAVTSKYMPLRTTVDVATQITNKFGKTSTRQLPIDIKTPYGNELTYFNEDKINKKLQLNRNKSQAYEEIKGMYVRGALETSLSPVTNIKKFVYSEIIWPRHENMYVNEVRQKTGYTNNFWVGSHEARVDRRGKTIHGQTTYGRGEAYRQSLPAGRDRGGASIWPLDEATGSLEKFPQADTYGNAQYRARWVHADDHSDLVGLGEGELVNRWSYPLKFNSGVFDHSGADKRMELEAAPLLALPHFVNATSSIAGPTQPPLVTCITGARGQEILGIKVLNDPDWPGYTRPDLIRTTAWTDQTGSTKIMPLHDSANWLGYVPIWSGFTAYQANTLAGKVTEVNAINTSPATAKTTGVQVVKFVSQSMDPWAYDYDDFKKEIRVKAKDYSVIPEFRMEDHVESYIKQKGGDFLSEQSSLFRMVGMPSGTLEAAANSSETNFYKVYGTTDFMKHFDILRNDIDEHFKPATITLQCNAYLKFNPYDGFYPAQRTLQMAAALSASYGKHISYTGPALLRSTSTVTVTASALGDFGDDGVMVPHDPSNPTAQPIVRIQGTTGNLKDRGSHKPALGATADANTNLAFRNFLTPLYAPGIMFNTIKAGIACDWPIMTSPEKIYKTRAGKSNYWALGHPNPEQDQELLNRFESLYSLGGQSTAKQKVNKRLLREIEPIRQGYYAVREFYRKGAIRAALVPLSASVGGFSSDGLQIQGIAQDNGTYKPGFYTAKLHVNEIPGLQQIAEPTWAFALGESPVSGGARPIVRIDVTASTPAPINMGRWDKRIPFEAILNPEKYMANQDLYDYTAHPSGSMNVTASWNGSGDGLYSLMTNNFMAAVPEFFLHNGNFTSIASRPQDELSLFAQAGEVYGMRIKMYRSLNRERSYANERVAALRSLKYNIPQDPRDDTGLHETFTMYSRTSAFGYPIFGRVHCIRDENGAFDVGGGTHFTTASMAIAHNLTAIYDNMDMHTIFKSVGDGSGDGTGVGPQYTTYGTQTIAATIFHTSSRQASADGVLDSLEGYNWSYTPPYMHGEAWCDLVFAPSISKTYSIAEILDSLRVVERRIDPGFEHPTGSTGLKSPQYVSNGYHSQSLYSAENINANAMQISSCVNLFGIGKVKTFAYSQLGQSGRPQASTTRRTVGDSPAWVIQPKFETPMLNFSPLPASKGGTCPRPLTDDILRLPLYGSASVARGIWHQFGTEPQGNEGVWMETGDIPKNWLDNHPEVEHGPNYAPFNATGSFFLHKYKRKSMGNNMKSLADFMGMDTTPVRLGRIRQKLTVNEAVVAVPFVEKDNQRHFFTIDPHMIDVALGEESYRLSDGSDAPGDSIQDMIRKMNKYVFPPVLDFVRNRELDAIAMYIFEFSMSFDKDDLSYIWQNLMPPSASGFKTSTSTVTHHLLANELMGYANKTSGEAMRDKVQWMVFKVKQRSATNYYDKVVKSTPELDKLSAISRSRQVRLGTSESATYSFNWPYDHFSIVEMAQIKADVEFSELPSNIPTLSRISPDGGIPGKRGGYVKATIPGQGVRGAVDPRFGAVGGGGPGGASLGLRGPLADILPGGVGTPGGVRTLDIDPLQFEPITPQLLDITPLEFDTSRMPGFGRVDDVPLPGVEDSFGYDDGFTTGVLDRRGAVDLSAGSTVSTGTAAEVELRTGAASGAVSTSRDVSGGAVDRTTLRFGDGPVAEAPVEATEFTPVSVPLTPFTFY